MQYRTMGKLGITSSVFGLGCMRFNGPASGDSVIDERKAISLIRRAIDGGVTYLDTAYIYLDKTSETVLGKALRDGYREKVTIATKVPKEAVRDRAGNVQTVSFGSMDGNYYREVTVDAAGESDLEVTYRLLCGNNITLAACTAQ